MYERINSIPLLSSRLPKGAFYVMVNISRVMGKQYKNIMIDGSLSFADVCLTQRRLP